MIFNMLNIKEKVDECDMPYQFKKGVVVQRFDWKCKGLGFDLKHGTNVFLAKQ